MKVLAGTKSCTCIFDAHCYCSCKQNHYSLFIERTQNQVQAGSPETKLPRTKYTREYNGNPCICAVIKLL